MNVDCDLWSLPAAETRVVSVRVFQICISLLPRRTGEPQGTVNGRWFLWDPYQKLTDSVECSPRHAGWEGFWTPGGAVAQMAEIRMSLQPPGDVPHERTWRDINQQDVLYCITTTSLF